MREMVISELLRFRNTATWSWQGWQATWTRQKSLRQWAVVNVISAFFALVLDLSGGERGLILALGIFILFAEVVNTAIEETIDYISLDHDPRAGRAKDCGSCAVALAAIAGGVAWLAILVG